jgi:hypothetical protein
MLNPFALNRFAEIVKRRGTLLLGAVPLAVVFTMTACGPNKINECNELIAVINKGIENLEKGQKKGGEAGPSELKAMADAMDKVAEDAAKVKLSIAQLKDFSEKYQKMAKDVATSARDMAAAAEEKNIDKMTKAQEAMEGAAKQEDPLVDGINKFCGAP